MAGEIRLQIMGQVSNGGFARQLGPWQMTLDQAAIGAQEGVVIVGTSEEDLAVGDVIYPAESERAALSISVMSRRNATRAAMSLSAPSTSSSSGEDSHPDTTRPPTRTQPGSASQPPFNGFSNTP